MEKRFRIKTIIWEVVFPLVLYYTAYLSTMYFTFAFIGYSTATYMTAQIISTAVTIPLMYFASYKPTQEAFSERPAISKVLVINIIYIVVITLLISAALNNIISMTPLIKLSSGYAAANESFYGSSLALELLGSGLLAPVMEELVFRGIVFGNLRKLVGTGTSVFLASFLFALVHFNIVQFIYAFLIGIILALLMYKSGHMYAAMIGHIVANTFAVIRTETGFMNQTMNGSTVAWGASCVMLIAGIVMFIFYMKRKKIVS